MTGLLGAQRFSASAGLATPPQGTMSIDLLITCRFSRWMAGCLDGYFRGVHACTPCPGEASSAWLLSIRAGAQTVD